MAVPGYQEFMFPVLKFLHDGKERHVKEIHEAMVIVFKLTPNDMEETLATQSRPTYMNRIGWALTYMKKAGLVNSLSRAHYVITAEGKKIVDNNVTDLNTNYLKKYPSFVDFQSRTGEPNKPNSEKSVDITTDTETPFEKISAYAKVIKTTICNELLSKILEQSAYFFEQLVVDLLLAMGYGGDVEDAGRATKKSGDEGIDGLIKEDKLGLDTIYIQAKRYQMDNVIGRPVVQQFAGALQGRGAKKGIFITTSRFTKEAIEEANRNINISIVLIDGEKLVDLMYEYNVGVSPEKTFTIKKVDYDYFE
jgi:restriction system protein